MNFFDLFLVQVLGKDGILLLVGFTTFILAFKNSQQLFRLIEEKTYGTRDYVLTKLEFLHIKIKSEHVTYLLLMSFFGFPFLTASVFLLIIPPVAVMIMFIVLMIFGFLIPRPIINMLVERRIKQYQGQMVDALNLVTNGLRAGLSMPQSIALVVSELPAPIAQEFNLILQQNKIGSPLEECLEDLAKRVPTEDNRMFVSAVNILRETGGNLAETFDTIVGVIRERIRLQQKIDTFTARSMMQGKVIASMPFMMAILYYYSNPEVMGKVYTSLPGIGILLIAFILDAIGAVIILKIVKIKV